MYLRSQREGYDIDDYNVFGASGATLRGLQAEFHNCYFEANTLQDILRVI